MDAVVCVENVSVVYPLWYDKIIQNRMGTIYFWINR